MSAKASGANAQPNGNTTNRAHHDGSSTRAYTVDQKDAVIRIRKCGATSFYDILGLESERKTVTSGGIKKAYHKLSLLTHPDKNGYPGADEAFKMVSRAFQILSDTDKKSRYDQFGGDPDARFSSSSASAAASNPFAGFARAGGPGMRAGGPAFEAEMSPEDLFRQFFGGGFDGGGFGGFGGPQFVFSGPGGFRVHQFGGARPRRRPPGTGADANQQQQPPSAGAMLMNMLPILLFFLLPLLSSLFSGASNWTSTPAFRPPPFSVDRPRPPDLTSERTTARLGVQFFYDSRAAVAYDKASWAAFDRAVEARLLSSLNRDCAAEREQRTALAERAYGWFTVDRDMLARADALPMPACGRLDGFRGRLGASY